MKTSFLILFLLAGSACGQVMRYDLSGVPAHLRRQEPTLLDGLVLGYRGTNVLVAVKSFVQIRTQGATTYARGGNGKMQAFTAPGQIINQPVTNLFVLKSYPKWREIRPGDRVSLMTIQGPPVQGTRDAYFVPKPKVAKTHTG